MRGHGPAESWLHSVTYLTCTYTSALELPMLTNAVDRHMGQKRVWKDDPERGIFVILYCRTAYRKVDWQPRHGTALRASHIYAFHAP